MTARGAGPRVFESFQDLDRGRFAMPAIAVGKDSEREVRIDSWCRWRIEKEETLRADIPAQTPPPIRDLPDVSLLVGLSRTRFLEELGEPFDGCGDRYGSGPERSCAESPRLSYSFYRLEGQPGGGDELWLDFDATGSCVQARWMGTQ